MSFIVFRCRKCGFYQFTKDTKKSKKCQRCGNINKLTEVVVVCRKETPKEAVTAVMRSNESKWVQNTS